MVQQLTLQSVPDLTARRGELSATHVAGRQFLFGARHFTLYEPRDATTQGVVLLIRSRPPFQDLPSYEVVFPGGEVGSTQATGVLESPLGPLNFQMSSFVEGKFGHLIVISILNTEKPQHWTKVVIANHDGERVLRQQPLHWALAHGGHLAALYRVDSAAGFSSKDSALPWRLTFTGYRAQDSNSPSGDGLYLQVDTWMTYLPQDETIMAYYELAVAKRADGTAVIVDVRIDTERAGGLVFWRVRLQERGTDHVDHWVWPFTRGALMRKLPVAASPAPATAG